MAFTEVNVSQARHAFAPNDVRCRPPRSSDSMPEAQNALAPSDVMLMLAKLNDVSLGVSAKKLWPTTPSVHGDVAVTNVRLLRR